jgi:hypothetical protein
VNFTGSAGIESSCDRARRSYPVFTSGISART